MTLSELFKRGGGHRAQLFGIFDTVLDCLASCHAINVIHRDLKPANIFIVTKDDEIKVLDFGVAQMRDATSERTARLAPGRRWASRQLDGRADVFSVGACLYTGIVERLRAQDRKRKSSSGRDAVGAVGRAWVPDGPRVAAFVDKALAYDRALRFKRTRDAHAAPEAAGRAEERQPQGGAQAATGVVVKERLDRRGRTSRTSSFDSRPTRSRACSYLGNAMSWVRQYGLGHPQTQRRWRSAIGSAPRSLRMPRSGGT
jgi:serine/threonine protein kinase